MADIIDKVLDPQVPGLVKQLDLAWRRNEAITSNIANAETPLYRAVDVNFERELERAFNQDTSPLRKTDSKHMDISGDGTAHLKPDLSGATKADGNNVDIDIQMGRLAYNSGQFTSATNILRKKLGMLRNILREGAR